MTLGPLALLSVLGLPVLLGAAALRALGIRFADDRLAYGGWAYLAGMLATAGLLFVWILLGLPIEARWLSPLLLVLAGGLWALGRRRDRRADWEVEPALPSPERGWGDVALYAVLVFAVVYTLVRMAVGSLRPTLLSDEALIWAAKAKAIFQAGGFNETFRAWTSSYVAPLHPDYPLLNPLLQVWVYAHAGEVVHFENRFPIQLSNVATWFVVAGAARRHGYASVAALLVLLLLPPKSTWVASRLVQSDVLVALGFAVALDAFLRGLDDARPRWLALGSVGLAFMLWSKNEGLFYAGALVAAVVAARWLPSSGTREPRLARRGAAWLAVPALVVAVTWSMNAAHGFENDLVSGVVGESVDEGGSPAFSAERISAVTRAFAWYFLTDVQSTGLLFVVFPLLVLLAPRRMLGGRMRVPTLALLFVVAGYALIYVATPRNVDWHLETSARRVTSQALPALAIWVGSALGGVLFRSAPGSTAE